MRKSFETSRDSTMRQNPKMRKTYLECGFLPRWKSKPLVAPRSDQGFLAYACIVRRRPAKARGFHATFEGLFEQNAQRAIRSRHMWRRIRQPFLHSATGISLRGVFDGLPSATRPEFPYAPRSRRRTRPIATAIIAITSAHKNVTPTSPAA